MLPPRWSYAEQLWQPLWDTINIATLGTVLAIVLGTPLGFLAARNTTPSVMVVRPIALFIIVSSRSINALIWGLLLVSVLGPGVLAGIIAIALRSIGFIGKLLYEAIEEIDETQVEAVRATGATGAQVMSYGIVPQILPAFATICVFRWDINIREVDRARPGRRRRHRACARSLAQHAGLAAGDRDPADDPRHRDRQRVGDGAGAPARSSEPLGSDPHVGHDALREDILGLGVAVGDALLVRVAQHLLPGRAVLLDAVRERVAAEHRAILRM